MSTTPDFYTIGYSGRTIEQFIATLREAGVKTLVDVRHLPLSQHKPAFSKLRLAIKLDENGMRYEHMPKLGIPGAVRKTCLEEGTLEQLWEWYDANAIVPAQMDVLRGIARRWRPAALMCTEADPLTCHRHRLALELERLGLKGVDL